MFKELQKWKRLLYCQLQSNDKTEKVTGEFYTMKQLSN
jgi:hypothetical protein